ncbi:MAG: phosphoglycerate dehydrogenase [Planctomycetes bacterium]|nr:phosphoglycerate dehydrogenase [Planctomycetota bacterium]
MPGKRASILVCDDLSPAALEIFRARGFEPVVALKQTEDQLVERVQAGVQALVVRSSTRVTRRVIEAASDLRVVGRAGVGVDNVDCDAASERGVVVMNTPTGNSTTTAELAIALLLALARHIPRADRITRSGSWEKKALTGSEITGKTLGIVGLGRIGRIVAERALGLRMQVLAFDPYLDPKLAAPVPGVEFAALDELCARADFVTLHVPLSDATRNLVSRERIGLMKKGARLVNCARGGLVDEAALLEALEAGRLAGAALDVLEEEPPRQGHPLVGREDVIVTPHLGASSHEAQHAVAVDVARQICDFFELGVAHNAVNLPAVGADTLRALAPWVQLAEKLGAFLAQVTQGPLARLELTLAGEITRADTRHLPLALLVGALRHQGLDAGVNFVNAPIFARERGLELFENRHEEHAMFQSALEVTSRAANGVSHHVTGTLLGRAALVVEFDGLRLDLEAQGPLLLTRHADQPGVVGLLGGVLGRAGVNIRRIELGPRAQGDGLATGVLALYSEPSAEALAELRALGPLREVMLVRL